ncbi:MAG TPA: ABC transporter substrate-binding protein, partial [Burkholderiales bacterium]|nr:ABC transporter substrate-binding protein [Burkholderiales bacterium]
MRKLAILIGGSVLALAWAAAATAADIVKIGVLMPLSGNSGNAGKSAVAAIELGADIVNSPHSGLAGLPLGAGQGLPKLGGAKIQLVIADTQGNPTEGQNQALRLITQEHVAAIVGTYHSNVSFTATAVAERYGIPYVVGDSVAANITGRGFKWVFRTTPIAGDFANNYMEFLGDLKKQGHTVSTLAIVYENTDYGTS